MHISEDTVTYGIGLLIGCSFCVLGIWVHRSARAYYRSEKLAGAHAIPRASWIMYLAQCRDLYKKQSLAEEMLDHNDLTPDELAAIYAYLPKPDFPFWEKDHGKKALIRHKKLHSQTTKHITYFFVKQKIVHLLSIRFRIPTFTKTKEKIDSLSER